MDERVLGNTDQEEQNEVDVSKAIVSIRECALQLALKEALAQQEYTGAVPTPPKYAAIVGRAHESVAELGV